MIEESSGLPSTNQPANQTIPNPAANAPEQPTSIVPIPEYCSLEFELSTDPASVLGGPKTSVKNPQTCTCDLSAKIPGLRALGNGVYISEFSNERMTLVSTPTVSKDTGKAICQLKCDNKDTEPSLDPQGHYFCSYCKVPATIRDATGVNIQTWDFIKDDAQKVCFYSRPQTSSGSPTFRSRDPNQDSEPTPESLGIIATSTYYTYNSSSRSYRSQSAKDLIPSCPYYSTNSSSSYAGVHSTPTAPTQCVISTTQTGGATYQDQYSPTTGSGGGYH